MTSNPRRVVLVGASRGLGLAAAHEFLDRGWSVLATVRDPAVLAPLAAQHPGRLDVIRVDVLDDTDLAALRDASRGADVLYVNAGVAGPDEPVGEVSTESFVQVMTTNALAPMRIVERVGPVLADDATIAVVSSRQGSISFNTRGGHEVYRASKSALNQLMRSYAARPNRPRRALLLLHPGWVQTELGGPGAQLTPQDSARGLVDVVENRRDLDELHFLDHTGATVPW